MRYEGELVESQLHRSLAAATAVDSIQLMKGTSRPRRISPIAALSVFVAVSLAACSDHPDSGPTGDSPEVVDVANDTPEKAAQGWAQALASGDCEAYTRYELQDPDEPRDCDMDNKEVQRFNDYRNLGLTFNKVDEYGEGEYEVWWKNAEGLNVSCLVTPVEVDGSWYIEPSSPEPWSLEP